MAQSWRSWGCKLAAGAAISGAIPFGIATLHASAEGGTPAQIKPDRTLGAESSVVTPSSTIDVIEGGATRGANLLHSFDEFSIPTGREAHFNNAPDIQNIISRVTGSSISKIDGLLRANGKANVFLLNPNGIIFGRNAELKIGGSFVASTASSISFADGTQFNATAHSTTPLLTVSVPIGLQFGGTAESIHNYSQTTDSTGKVVGLQVQPGTTLALVGGNVSLDGGNLWAPGGRVELAGVAGAGTVGFQVDSNNLRLSFPGGVQRADVTLTNSSEVNVRSGDGGSIAINSRSLDVLGGSKVRAGIASGSGSIGSQAGDIEINAQEQITIAGADSIIGNAVPPLAVGNGGDINIQTGSLYVTDGAKVRANTAGRGNAGNVNIDATSTVSLAGVGSDGDSGGVFSRVEDEAKGNGGNINIQTGSFEVTDGAKVRANTAGWGNAGSVTIDADTVTLQGVGSNNQSSGIFSRVEHEAKGKGGNINITSELLFVTSGAIVSVDTEAQGNAGNVTIDADTVNFEGVGSNNQSSGVFSRTREKAWGDGGTIDIKADSLFVSNGARVSANTSGAGDAGSVTIKIRDTISLNGAGSNGNPSGIVAEALRSSTLR